MARRSEGRVALVTGGARGIGEATAERLAEDGAAIAIADLDGDGAEATAARIAARHGVKAIGLKANVTVAAEVEAMVEEIALRLGSLDILVNNAGITRDNLIYKMTDDDWDAVAAVHLKGAFLCSRAAQREMVKRGWGRIVNLSSVSALGNRGQTNYADRQGRAAGHGEDPGDRTRPLRHHRQRGGARLYRHRDDAVGRDPARPRPRGMAERDGRADPGAPRSACRATSRTSSPFCAATRRRSSPGR